MDKNLKEKLRAKDKWLHGLFTVFLLIAKSILSCLINITKLFQLVVNFIYDKPHDRLLGFSSRLNNYLLQIVNFLTFSSIQPFPFDYLPKN